MQKEYIYPKIKFFRNNDEIHAITTCRVKHSDGKYYLIEVKHRTVEDGDFRGEDALFFFFNKIVEITNDIQYNIGVTSDKKWELDENQE